MGSITTPPSDSPLSDGRQVVYSLGPMCINDNDAVDANSGNWSQSASNFNTSGTAGIAIVDSLLNAVTRTGRVCRSAQGGAANTVAGFYVVAQNSAAGRYNILFPGQNRDAGCKMFMYGGTDSVVSTLATTEMLFGALSALNRVPQAGNGLTAAGNAWIGLYSDATGDLRFGYKNVGGAIVRLDGGALTPNLTWAPYQFWRVAFDFNPNGPTTTYSLSYMDAAGINFVPAVRGSTTGFNPGRFAIGPTWYAMRRTAGERLDMWLSNMTIVAYPYGSLSL